MWHRRLKGDNRSDAFRVDEVEYGPARTSESDQPLGYHTQLINKKLSGKESESTGTNDEGQENENIESQIFVHSKRKNLQHRYYFSERVRGVCTVNEL